MLSQVSKRFAVRTLSTSRAAFSPAGDKFNDKERAEEAAYIKKHEAEQLSKLKEQLDKQREEIDKLKEQLDKK